VVCTSSARTHTFSARWAFQRNRTGTRPQVGLTFQGGARGDLLIWCAQHAQRAKLAQHAQQHVHWTNRRAPSTIMQLALAYLALVAIALTGFAASEDGPLPVELPGHCAPECDPCTPALSTRDPRSLAALFLLVAQSCKFLPHVLLCFLVYQHILYCRRLTQSAHTAKQSVIEPVAGLRATVELIPDYGNCPVTYRGYRWYVSWGDGVSSVKNVSALTPQQAQYTCKHCDWGSSCYRRCHCSMPFPTSGSSTACSQQCYPCLRLRLLSCHFCCQVVYVFSDSACPLEATPSWHYSAIWLSFPLYAVFCTKIVVFSSYGKSLVYSRLPRFPSHWTLLRHPVCHSPHGPRRRQDRVVQRHYLVLQLPVLLLRALQQSIESHRRFLNIPVNEPAHNCFYPTLRAFAPPVCQLASPWPMPPAIAYLQSISNTGRRCVRINVPVCVMLCFGSQASPISTAAAGMRRAESG